MHSRVEVLDLNEIERDRVRAAFGRIERRLAQEDPKLVARVQEVPRGEAASVATIFGLLVLSVLLLAVGIGVQSATAWFAGGAAFLASFAVDHRRRRRIEASDGAG